MKRFGLSVFVGCLWLGAMLVGAMFIEQSWATYTPTMYDVPRGYVHVRPGGVASDDTLPGADTSLWSNLEDWVRIPQDWSSISIAVYGYGDGSAEGNPENGTFTATVYLGHEYSGALDVCTVTGSIGQVQMSHDPVTGPGSEYRTGGVADPNYKWAELLTLSSECWRAPVSVSGKVNGIGEINVNPFGATHVKVFFTSKTNISTLYAVMTGRK